MSQQWGGQPPPAFQYPMQTGIQFQQPMQAQATGYPGLVQQQRPPQLGGLQPQPTGFPAQFQQPQATGFQRPPMGQLQFQQSGAIPPVPQLPANLAGQNRFLSPSPGIPSQPTGFPGAGGGSNFLTTPTSASPLMPQMTGYMDPRLAMMGSTLMPSASGAFPAGAGGGRPQFGGTSLQQSIAQHNEAQRGSSTVRIPWALSKQERKQYDQIFRAWDPTASGFLDGGKALEVFGASGLDQNDLANIWTLADPSDRGKLNREEFHVAMGLIYRGLNGNTIPDVLPPELVPPSEKNLDESVDILRDILKNETYNRATNGSELSQSKRKDRSLYGNDTQDPRKDGTVYKHYDDEDIPVYRSKSRTIDRQAVRTGKESATEDIAELQRQLESANKQLGNFSAQQAQRTAEDDELDRRLDELKRRVKRVQDDIDYVSQGPRSFSKDEERRKLERELLNLLHEDLPEVQRKIEERERRRKREKDEWTTERNRRNYASGRYGGRDDDYGREDFERYERDRERREDRGYLRGTYDRDDRDRDRDRDDRDRYGGRRDYDRDRDRERYGHERPRSPPRDRTPPPPPPVPAATESRAPPPAPSPTPATKPALKNMTREEREAFIRAEAQKRLQERMAKLGVVSPSSGSGSSTPLDSAVEDRLAKEKAEAEEKARHAEKEMDEREKARKARLASERGEVEEKPTSPAPPMPAPAPVVAPAAPTPPAPAIKRGPAPPPPVSRKKPAPPPPASRSSYIRSPAPSPAAPVPKPLTPAAAPAAPAPPLQPAIDPEEEALKTREEVIRKRREAQKARLLALEKEEEEARLEQERFEARRRALQEQKSANATPPPPPPAPPVVVTSPPVSVPPPPPPPAEVSTPSSTNPFRLGQGAAATSPGGPAAGGTNPFFRPPQPPAPPTPTTVTRSPTPPITSLPPPQRQAEPPTPNKPSTYNKPPPDSDDESGWGEEKDEEEDSSDDDRTARQKLAQHLFGTVMPARPASAASGGGAQSAPRTPPTTSVGIPPPPPPPGPTVVAPIPTAATAAGVPPPPPPMPPAPPSVSLPPPAAAPAPAPTGGRGALMASIVGGAKLKPTKTIDRSGVQGAGAVLGNAAPPTHINAAPRPASPPASIHPVTQAAAANGHAYKESVDWYAGLAAEIGHKAPPPTLPSLEEEPAVAVPAINVSSEDAEPVHTEEDHDPLEDVDLGTTHRVRSIYKYEGSRGEDLVFGENVVILAHPSKSGGPWWYGSISSSGVKGFFPGSYVQILDDIKAAAMYPYAAGNPDELSFEEGDVLTIVDRSEPDWWKAEKDDKIYVVPAAYLEVVNGLLPRALSATPTTAVRELESERSPSQAGQDIEQDESNSEDSSEGWDDSDSDTNPSEGEEMTEDQRQHEREQRELERIRVLEAAGLIIKQPAEGKRPPAPPMRRRSTKKGRRPPPTAPLPSPPAATHDRERELPPLPPPSPRARLDDAYERYEAFKSREAMIPSTSNRDSVALTVSDASSIPPSSPRIPITPGMGTVSLSPATPPPPALHESKSGAYTGLLSFLSRSKTPGEEKKPVSVASISAPMISAPIPVTAVATPTRENSPAFGSNWSSLLDKTALQEIPSGERKRQETIFELINTESAYVRDLQLIVEVFYANIMPLLDDKATTVIFANVEDILLTNTAFLSQLEGRQKECRLYIDNIGDLLEKHIGDMGVYMQYCVNQSNAIRILQSLRDAKPELAAKLQHLRENDPSVRSLDLSSYLLIPMQRLTRYPLLIRQILNYTESGVDREKIENSLIAAETILEAINESIREQEGQERLAELSRELWVGQGHLDLTAPTRFLGPRRLLKEGLLVKAKSRRRLRAILCTDILILVEEATKTVYGNPMPLPDVAIHELPGGRDDMAFQIATSHPRGGRTINLRASSAGDCQRWMTTIEQARRRYVGAEKKSVRRRKESRTSRGSLGSVLG